MTPLLLKLVFPDTSECSASPARPVAMSSIGQATASPIRDSNVHIDYWDAELAKSEWFAGREFTAADIMMSSRWRPPRRAPTPSRGPW